MTSPDDQLILTHPDIPDSKVVRSRQAYDRLKKKGWKIYKSPAPADETKKTPRKGTAPLGKGS